jgi:hypothetical protein
MRAAHESARCLFCGSVALRPADLSEPIPVPDVAIPFEVSEHRAGAAFRKWASASWWYPKALRELSIELEPVMLPAWRFDADVETHWAGLRDATTRSGLRPCAGVDRRTSRTMVPASLGITEGELHALQPFDERVTEAFAATPTPYEVPALSKTGARPVAHERLATEHRKLITEREGLRRCRGGSKVDVTDTRLLMLPIYVGSFRYREVPWRFVINAQTGRVTGKAPLDRVKVIAVALLTAAVAALWFWWTR